LLIFLDLSPFFNIIKMSDYNYVKSLINGSALNEGDKTDRAFTRSPAREITFRTGSN